MAGILPICLIACAFLNSFEGCTSLEAFTAKKLVSIGATAFQGCTSLKSVTVPETVTGIGSYCTDGDITK